MTQNGQRHSGSWRVFLLDDGLFSILRKGQTRWGTWISNELIKASSFDRPGVKLSADCGAMVLQVSAS
jgi:hypothetical protein